MVDGRIMKRGGKLVGIDVEAILAAAKGWLCAFGRRQEACWLCVAHAEP